MTFNIKLIKTKLKCYNDLLILLFTQLNSYKFRVQIYYILTNLFKLSNSTTLFKKCDVINRKKYKKKSVKPINLIICIYISFSPSVHILHKLPHFKIQFGIVGLKYGSLKIRSEKVGELLKSGKLVS